MSYIESMSNENLNHSILKIFNKINIKKIIEFIDNIDSISLIRKNFYKEILVNRYNILKSVYNKLN